MITALVVMKHPLNTIVAGLRLASTTAGCQAYESEAQQHAPQETTAHHENRLNDAVDPEPPEMPDEVCESTLEGAEAAARYYIRAYEYGFAALDAAPLEKVCMEGSRTCTENIE